MPLLTERFTRAADYARQAHDGQLCRGTSIPYLAHLLGVASLVLEHGGNEDQAIAGLLHDVIRLCGDSHQQTMREQFGATVAGLIDASSESLGEDAAIPRLHYAQLLDWQQRKLEYIARLSRVGEAALLVAACDKLHRARGIVGDLENPKLGPAVFERFIGGRDGTLAYYQSLSRMFTNRGCPVAPRLDMVVVRMHVRAGATERRGLTVSAVPGATGAD